MERGHSLSLPKDGNEIFFLLLNNLPLMVHISLLLQRHIGNKKEKNGKRLEYEEK